MLSWFHDKPEERACISINRTYEGVVYPTEHILKPAKSIRKIIQKLQNEPKFYQNHYMRKDVLPKLPALYLDIGDHGFHPEYPEVPIVANIHLAHNSPPAKPQLSIFQKMLVLVLAIAIPSLLSTYLLLDRVAERNNIERACYLYTKNGQPDSIYIAGTTVDYPEDGLTNQQIAMLNPWIMETVLDPWERCIVINTR